MTPARTYVVITILAFIAMAWLLLFYRRSKEGERLTPLAGMAFGVIVASTFFGDNRSLGYVLLVLGVALAGFEAWWRGRRK